MSIQLRQGTDVDRQPLIFDVGELVYTIDTKKVFIGDGVTAGGVDIYNLHDHDSVYFTQAQITGMLLGYTSSASFNNHVNNADIHRVINDGGITLTDLWSANKINSELSGKAPTSHNHDSLYYTQSQIDNLLNALTDENVKTIASDASAGYLDDKIIADQGINKGLQTVSDTKMVLFTDVYLASINGYTQVVYLDSTKGGKILSADTANYMFMEAALGNNDWIQIGHATDAQAGHVVPYDATIVGITLQCENDNGRTKAIRLYVDANEVDTNIIQTLGNGGDNAVVDNSLNINVNAGQKLRLRGGGGGTIQDTIVTLYVKWRA